jgi:hypothetical protein
MDQWLGSGIVGLPFQLAEDTVVYGESSNVTVALGD